ncbi:MAG: hypothetical protein ACR2P4_02065 [Gammaproteobacteria bacterium]
MPPLQGFYIVIPAKAGIQHIDALRQCPARPEWHKQPPKTTSQSAAAIAAALDSRFRGNDERGGGAG